MRDPYDVWSIQPKTELGRLSMEDRLLHLVSWAVLSANSHNSQPWRLGLDPSRGAVHVAVEGEALLPESDGRGRQTAISLGCALETLKQAATAYGLQTRVELLEPEEIEADTLVGVLLISGDIDLTAAGVHTLETLRSRQVNRSRYTREPLPEELVRALATQADEGLTVDCITDRSTLLALSELQYMADRAVIALPGFRMELQGYLLPNESQATVGMPGHTFGLGDDIARRVHQDLGTRGLFNPDWASGFAMGNRDGIRSAPVLVVISSARNDPRSWVRAGMCYQRCELLAERYGRTTAIHAAMVESTGINVLLRARLKRRARPTMVFRVGTPTEKRGHSPRRSAEEVSRLVCG